MFTQDYNHTPNPIRGFTLIELMIVIATLAIILAVSMPILSNYSIRIKIAKTLNEADTAKMSVESACEENMEMSEVGLLQDVRQFVAKVDNTYVAHIRANGTCSAPVITVMTQSTGYIPDPILTTTGTKIGDGGQIIWQCTSINTPKWLLPVGCRG